MEENKAENDAREENKAENSAVGTRLGDLLVQKGIENVETAPYEARIKYLEQENKNLEQKNKDISEKLASLKAVMEQKNDVLSEELAHQKSLIQKMEQEKIGAADSLFKRAVQELKEENYIDAMGMLQAHMIYEPENTKAMINLAVAYAELDYHDRAKKMLHNVLEHDPDNETAKKNLAILNEDQV
ncbi:tetratricopeptide repeat protein [Desulfonema magnum]|uniref:Tetratricopeptide repeat-containing protein n=1 Tax=Desulfonema magnum TaxID=45655 RepID=A0A975BN25_9BACT|nr:tetratricopeptide repeat protein [Desulfonema magnum]QTA88029.1 Tetratricopeptide repeat-containing protein [Desulfonema magnum]